MIQPIRKSTSRRLALTATFLIAAGASLSALAYWPWEQISVTSHYDANGSLVGVEAVGACGFPLVGSTGASSSQRMYSCSQIDQIEMPF